MDVSIPKNKREIYNELYCLTCQIKYKSCNNHMQSRIQVVFIPLRMRHLVVLLCVLPLENHSLNLPRELNLSVSTAIAW